MLYEDPISIAAAVLASSLLAPGVVALANGSDIIRSGAPMIAAPIAALAIWWGARVGLGCSTRSMSIARVVCWAAFATLVSTCLGIAAQRSAGLDRLLLAAACGLPVAALLAAAVQSRR